MTARPTLHDRIRTDVETRILSGKLKPGDKIPSELALMETYRCSRMTVSKALSTLSAAGLLSRRKRAGTVVAARPTESMVLDVPDLPIEIARRGQSYRFELLGRQLRAPRQGDSQERDLAGTGKLLLLQGIHLADETPFAFEDRRVSVEAVPAMTAVDFSAQPPGSWLLHHIPWTEAENRIAAIAADESRAAHLNIAVGAPCLAVERRTWRGKVGVTMVRQTFVAGMYELVARFGPS